MIAFILSVTFDAVCFFVGDFLSNESQIICIIISLAMNIPFGVIQYYIRDPASPHACPADQHHITERYGLFTILLLGNTN